MEQLGLGGVGRSAIDSATVDRRRTADTRGERDAGYAADREAMLTASASADARRSLKPEDSLLIDIDFKKDKPPRIESQGPDLPPITIPGGAGAGARAAGA